MPELAPYAVTPENSRGRIHPEPTPAERSDFQRDRDRIVHSTAFRRLEYKTQVFVNHEGDLFRTRLTHTIEVAQLARSIARALRVNEDLAEAIALAHDLGHTPFGHAGQDALNACMKDFGGFEHNLQSLRIVDLLEERYAAFDGLNLCFETREGILKHCSPQNARSLGELGKRFQERTQPSLEAQICNLADEIAYNNHDVDDGLRSGLLSLEQLDDVPLVAQLRREGRAEHPTLGGRRLLFEVIRRLLSAQVYDVIDASARALREAAPSDADEARRAPTLIVFSPGMRAAGTELKRFLHRNLYRHPRVVETTGLGKQVVRELFEAYLGDPAGLARITLAASSARP